MSDFLTPESITFQLGLFEGMRVSDFGCGSGHMTIEIAKKIGKEGVINAVDVQTTALEAVKAKALSLGLENVNPVHADLEVVGGTSIEASSQDLVFISQALFQSQKKGEILNEAARILKNGGKLIMIEWRKSGGGLGPPDDLRSSEEELRTVASGSGFAFERNINTDQFHIGLAFIKP